MLAIIVGSAASMNALTRTYTVETYTIVGMAAAYYQCVTDGYRHSYIRCDLGLLVRMTVVSLLYLFFVRLQCLASV